MVAEWLTEVENHKYEHQHENSLVIKRFLFEAFDCYVALFYTAFYELDPIALRQELIGLYTVDSIRRVLCETVIPLLLQYARRWCSGNKADILLKKKKKDDDYGQEEAKLEKERELEEVCTEAVYAKIT